MSTLKRKLTLSEQARRKIANMGKRWRSATLITGGLGFLCGAAYTWATTAGLVATGVALLVLELCSKEGK